MQIIPQIKTYKDKKETELETVSIKGLEIFSVGKWNGDEYSQSDLEAIVDAFDKVGFEPIVKAGHEDAQEDPKISKRIFGVPALGYVERLRLKGGKLMADLKEVPKRFAELVKAGSYKCVSAEIYWDYRHEATNKVFPRVLKAIAFLGAEIPALTNLESIESLFTLSDYGSLRAYDEKGHEFRAYESDSKQYDGMSLADFLVNYPRKEKAEVEYEKASNEAEERCGLCKFFIGYPAACALVEGRIERDYVCSLFEMQPQLEARLSANNGSQIVQVAEHKIVKRGKKWCVLSSSGSTLGCHDTRGKALAQLGAVEASKARAKKQAHKEDLMEEYTIEERDGKWTVLSEDGEEVEKFDTEEEAKEYLGKMKSKRKKTPMMPDDDDEEDEEVKMKKKKKKLNKKGGYSFKEGEEEGMTAEEFESTMKTREDELRKDFDKRYKAAEGENEKLRADVRKLQADRRKERLQAWVNEKKAESKILPKEEIKVFALLEYLPDEGGEIAYFSAENGEKKEVKQSPADLFKSIIDGRDAKLFKELSRDGGQPPGAKPGDFTGSYENPGVEVDRRAKEYQKEHKDTTYGDAIRGVLREDPQLAAKYHKSAH